jgi:hypothetical protein
MFIEGRYDTGFIDQYLVGGKGGPTVDPGEARRVAHMLAAIAAYRRDKARSERAARRPSGGASEPWKEYARRSQMRGNLR